MSKKIKIKKNTQVIIEPKITEQLVYTLCVYTTRVLKEQQNKLQKIKWTDGESNLDTEYSILACDCCSNAWNIIKQQYPEYSKINIVCNIPDINITFIYPNDTHVNKKIELKSSKNLKMPGSTIKKLDINQPLIYCLKPQNITDEYKIRCSQYHNAMGESNIDLFQDRTPRPCINFEKMKDINDVLPFENKEKKSWIEHYAKSALNRIDESAQCQHSWQDDMVKIMKKTFIDDYLKNTSIEQIEVDKMTLQLENTNI